MAEAKNPYTPRVLELSAALETLRGELIPPMFSEEEIAKRRAAQRRDEELATLAKLSGQKDLSAVGGVLLPEALARSKLRYTEHGEFDPLSGELNVFPQYSRRMAEERKARELQTTQLRADQFEANKPYRDATAALQQARIDALAAKTAAAAEARNVGKPLTSPQLKLMEQQGSALDNLDDVEKNMESFKGEASKGVEFVGQLQDTIAMKYPFATPQDWKKNQRAWAELQRIQEMPERYKLFGATLTANELTSWKLVSPSRGWSNEQITEWINERKRIAARAAARNARGLALGGANKAQLEHYSRGKWTAPKDEELSPQEQAELEELRAKYGKRP